MLSGRLTSYMIQDEMKELNFFEANIRNAKLILGKKEINLENIFKANQPVIGLGCLLYAPIKQLDQAYKH